MPELPDIVAYIEALEKRIVGQKIESIRIASPFLLRTAAPPLSAAEGKAVTEIRRMGKRICIGLEDDLWLVLHLMIAGRLHWKERGVKLARPREPSCILLPTWRVTVDRSRHPVTRLAARCRRRGRPARP